jgi:hypothetical protein
VDNHASILSSPKMPMESKEARNQPGGQPPSTLYRRLQDNLPTEGLTTLDL